MNRTLSEIYETAAQAAWVAFLAIASEKAAMAKWEWDQPTEAHKEAFKSGFFMGLLAASSGKVPL